MNILIIDAMAAGLDFALRCEAQGHVVKIWYPKDTRTGGDIPVGRGLLDIVANWQSWMKWADLVFLTDNARFTRELEHYRAKGYPIFGPNVEGTTWELERGTGQAVLEAHGITCMESTIFSNYDEAIAYLNANPGRYVSKPTGDADKALSYVAKSAEDMLFMLERWKRTMKKKVPFLFQKFTPGIEMAVGGWVGRDGFLPHFLENFEFKKLMPGEIGVNTGEMGTAMKYCSAEESLLAREMLLPLEAALIRSGYTGYIDVAVIIDKAGKPWPLEFTTRPGWPLFQIQQVLHEDVAEWMLEAVRGGACSFEPKQGIAVGVVVAIPDFPYGKLTRDEVSGYPIFGITDSNRYYIHPSEVKGGIINGKPMLVSAGNYLLTVSGVAGTVQGAIDGAYKRVKELVIPNSPIYRNDIGKRLEAQLPELQALGYAESWEW
jgi:phosphoribosylamine--glycine ligase